MVKLSTCASPSVACLGSRCNGLSTSSVRRTLCLPCTLGQPCAEASLSGSTLRPDPVQWVARSDPQPAPAGRLQAKVEVAVVQRLRHLLRASLRLVRLIPIFSWVRSDLHSSGKTEHVRI